MKTSIPLLAFATAVQAHYTLPAFQGQAEWQHVRQWNGYYTNNFVGDVSSLDIRCNVGASTKSAPSTLSVSAGSTLTFTVNPNLYHPGPELVYLAKVPSGKTAANWDGSGAVWFKIHQKGPVFGSQLTWSNLNAATISFKIPSATPSGEYLVRGEHIGLHSAGTTGGSQHYLSCGQINVTGGGSGTPGPLVAFPGAYSSSDPGLKINIYYPVPTTYTYPGPKVWSG